MVQDESGRWEKPFSCSSLPTTACTGACRFGYTRVLQHVAESRCRAMQCMECACVDLHGFRVVASHLRGLNLLPFHQKYSCR